MEVGIFQSPLVWLACSGSRGNSTEVAARVALYADGLEPKSQRIAPRLPVQVEMRISSTLIGNTTAVVRHRFDVPSQVSGLEGSASKSQEQTPYTSSSAEVQQYVCIQSYIW